MLTEFTAVPDWPGTAGVDGGVAVGDLTGDGSRDLVVFAIDAPAGPNPGLYRVGRGVVDGAVTGGWGPWQRVPDWPFWENAGGGIALADLDGSGAPDLVLFAVDAPQGPNVGLVRVARGLDRDGVPTGGWGPWQTVPDWPFWENQGADCAVADVDGDGRAELVLLIADAPVGPNIGLYRTAALAADGTASGWSPWVAVPDWVGTENAGVGVTVGDIDGDGTPELLVCVVDAAEGRNDAHYCLGWRLDGRGRPADGWGPWRTVPGWRFHENQGCAVTLLDEGGGGEANLLVLAVDDPVGPNAGLTRVVPVETDLGAAAQEGVWRILETDTQVLAVHAVLLHTGDVLLFAGSGNDPDEAAARRYGTRVWHYPTPEMSAPGTPVDLFCCGHAQLPDGRVLAAGGTERYDPFVGLRQCVAFDPHRGPESAASPTGRAGEWVVAPEMGEGRWYPTLVALPDGDVLAVSGLGADGFLSLVPERRAADGDWTALPPSPPWPMYGHLFLLADGRLFYSGAQYGANNGQRPAVWDPVAGTVVRVDGLPEPQYRNQAASVLLPPAQDQRVLVVGGGGADVHAVGTTGTAAVVDLTGPHPTYVPAPPLHHPRMHLCATLLPDRTVLVNGGSGMEESHHHASPHAEIYHPRTGTWRGAAASRVDRLYHSVALLVPDGKVVTAGSNPQRKEEELRIEVFWPPYLFAGPRPTVEPEATDLHYGATVAARVADPAGLREASLLRPGATTHSCDVEQRLVDLPLRPTGPTTVELAIPDAPALAPPGWYQLVVVSTAGVPSEGVWVQLSRAT
ncbi:galactose oxidase-like domain-containing protein [Pseudonocardia lacus]|uniref:galactose oxidase-like domain-containing protein n=1 Tax=Pseudonocardia lacus TaxID=2835865 RepID=UPI002027B549|nr:galactose oxidase-like domain-containing protein [Pseudonocardia lacus]